jgi:alpha-tubulin suppressor-like RCC1 family protein
VGDFNNRNIPTLNPSLLNIIQIYGGIEHSIALNNKGEVFTFGGNWVILYII